MSSVIHNYCICIEECATSDTHLLIPISNIPKDSLKLMNTYVKVKNINVEQNLYIDLKKVYTSTTEMIVPAYILLEEYIKIHQTKTFDKTSMNDIMDVFLFH